MSSTPAQPLSIRETLQTRRKAWKVKELADVLNMTQSGLYSAVSRGSIPAAKIGTATRFDPKEIADWYESNCRAA